MTRKELEAENKRLRIWLENAVKFIYDCGHHCTAEKYARALQRKQKGRKG